MMSAFRRGWRPFGVAAALGAAAAAGWLFGARRPDEGSLKYGPATAPARLETGPGQLPAPPVEAETAEVSVQSARDEGANTIRTDGAAAAAVGGAADGHNDQLLDLVAGEARQVTVRLAAEIAGLRRDLEDRNRRMGRTRRRMRRSRRGSRTRIRTWAWWSWTAAPGRASGTGCR